MKKTTAFTARTLLLGFLVFISPLLHAETVGKVTAIDLERRLIEIDESVYRLLNTTQISHARSSSRKNINDVRRGQVVSVVIENESIISLKILPLNDVPM